MPCGWIWVTVKDVMSLKFNSSHYNALYVRWLSRNVTSDEF